MQPTPDLSAGRVADALHQFGAYRVKRTGQAVAELPNPRGVTQAILLALGLRESFLTNVEGGAKLVDGRWVRQDDPDQMDVGPFQISRYYHAGVLAKMPGVKVGTWKPVVQGRTANDGGFAPRFEDSLQYAISELVATVLWARGQGVPRVDRLSVAIAAHNAGRGGALRGYQAGDVDRYTARADYSTWVLRHAAIVTTWLGHHPSMRA